MTSHIFILGRVPALAFAELKTFFPDIRLVSQSVAASDHPLALPADLFITKLGGTVKIAEALGRVNAISAESLAPFITHASGRVVFGVSVYGQELKASRQLLEDIKERIGALGISARFVEARKGTTLSSVVVAKDKLVELILVKQDDGYIVGKTIAVQPFEDWGERDFGRPYADPVAGMLPPKVARMVVNIADGSRDISRPLAQKTLLDPFCGMGTILGEALMMGWNAMGSDISAEVVEKARGNLHWLTKKTEGVPGVTFRLDVADAVHVSTIATPQSVDAIVTEPYMGDARKLQSGKKADVQYVKNIIKGLEKLYIGCLRDWHKVLKKGGVVVMALPIYNINGKTYFVKKVIDMCEMLGYTTLAGPIEYSRPQAVVKRNFFVWHT